MDEPVPPRLAVDARLAIYERCTSAFRALLAEALAAYAGKRLNKDVEACLWSWTADQDFLPEQIKGDTLRRKLQNGRDWWRLCNPAAPVEKPLTARVRHRDQVELIAEAVDDPGERTEREARADEMDCILARHEQVLTDTLLSLRRRTSPRLAVAWAWAARRHLTMVRQQQGVTHHPDSAQNSGRPKEGALAGALYLVLFCGEMGSLPPFEREILEAAYLPVDGATDQAPYEAHRLPDGELAKRIYGSRRGRARGMRDQLLTLLRAITEGWWQRFATATVLRANTDELLTADLAWQTFTPTVYDVWRLDDPRPPGRSDLDFQRWRGRGDMGQQRRGRGRKPPGPRGGLPADAAVAYVRGELSIEEEREVARYLIASASVVELGQLTILAESVAPGALWWARLRNIATEASVRLISFAVRLESGAPVPAMLDGGNRPLAEGEVVAIMVGIEHPTWVAVFRRVDGGAVDWAQRWTLLQPSPQPVELCGYALDDGETGVDLLVALLGEGPPEAADALLALAALAELPPGRVRWRSCQLSTSVW